VRLYTVLRGGGKNEVNEDDSSGGLIGHCVSPQPWREIDAHADSDNVSDADASADIVTIREVIEEEEEDFA